MQWIRLHPQSVRDALRKPVTLGPDLLVLAFGAAFVGALITLSQHAVSPMRESITIDLSLGALPGYVLLSLGRGFGAYILSLIFTLIYGSIAAHHKRAERIMIPALDVLQAIPVLGFLPGLVLAMIALFPTREIGLELACILMIFSAQVWNMTFSFHSSLRNIPQPLREVAKIHHFRGWQTFRLLELPAAMIGLVWNSMMSMAGGWFFLTVNEAFRLNDRDFRLPGIGSYMAEAINKGDTTAMIAGIIAMMCMIVFVDQVFWRPIVVWSQGFKLEETVETESSRSWVLSLLRRSHVWKALKSRLIRMRRQVDQVSERIRSTTRSTPFPVQGRAEPAARTGRDSISILERIMRRLILAVIMIGFAWGAWRMIRLMAGLPLIDPAAHEDWIHVVLATLASFLRTTSAVFLGAAWALPAGICIGLSRKWSQRLQPVIQIVASFPAPMLFPLLTLLVAWLHIPFTIGCISLMLLGSQWYILFNVIAGATAIPADLKEVAGVYGLSRWQRWMRLYLPCVFPYLVTGLVTAAGGAWNATIVSEFVQLKGQTYSAFGLGSMITTATSTGNYSLLCAAVVTMAVTVVLLNRAVWKRLYRLAESRFSLVF